MCCLDAEWGSGNEIYAFNYTGGITEIFPYYKNGIIYGVREEKNATKGYLVEINLKEKTVKKISGGNMICNFVMSPEGSKIWSDQCSRRSDLFHILFIHIVSGAETDTHRCLSDSNPASADCSYGYFCRSVCLAFYKKSKKSNESMNVYYFKKLKQ